jgi:hypothetical protein
MMKILSVLQEKLMLKIIRLLELMVSLFQWYKYHFQMLKHQAILSYGIVVLIVGNLKEFSLTIPIQL